MTEAHKANVTVVRKTYRRISGLLIELKCLFVRLNDTAGVKEIATDFFVSD